MKRIWLFIILLTLQVNVFTIYPSGHNNIFIQIKDTVEVNNQLNLYFKLIQFDTANARKSLEEALVISRKLEYLKGIESSSSYLGSYYLGQFNLPKAEDYFQESFDASKKSGNKMIEGKNANNLGIISEKKGDYGSAISNYLYAYELFDSLHNTTGVSAITNNIGIVYYLLNEPAKALNFFKISLALKQQLNDSLSMVYAYQNLGNVYFDLWKYDSSKYYYNKCIDLSESVSDIVSAGKALNSMGVIARLENDNKQAFKLFRRSLQYSALKNDVQNMSAVYDNLGLLDFDSWSIKTAAAYFDSSLTVSAKYGLKEEMKNVYQHLSSLYAKQEKYKDAFLNLQNYDNLQNDLLTEKSNVTGIEGLFIKQKQENKILQLEKEQEKRKTQVILSLAVLLIVLVISTLGFYIYRITQKSKNARTLAHLEKERFKAVIEAQEMERKRIAGDLHDSVGQMLSLSKLNLSEIIDSSNKYSPEHENMLARSAQIIDEVCQEIRNISHNLMPGPLIRLGLMSAVRDLVRKINSSNKIHVSLSDNLDDVRFDEKVEISVYRIIQEILNNILKHAKASEIDISLNKQNEGKLELLITDNGIGFDTGKIVKSNGIGWKNIYSRLAIINGTMIVNSIKNHGTGIDIKVYL
jgi:two-component system, NarL family, sensor kinase